LITYRNLVDLSILVNEAHIAAAMRDYIDSHHHLIEGAAGAAAATCKPSAPICKDAWWASWRVVPASV
jgi:threonine dehydratase